LESEFFGQTNCFRKRGLNSTLMAMSDPPSCGSGPG
jgi:hypothetical protein